MKKMKTINLFALSQLTVDDIGIFLSWLGRGPDIGLGLEQMKKNLPLGTSKIGSILKILESFELIARKQDRYILTSTGRDFSNSGMMVKSAVLRNLFMRVEPVQKLMKLLQTSASGRLPVKFVHVSFSLGLLSIVSDAEILGFLSWAQACALFGVDTMAEEIFRIDLGISKDSVEAIKGSEDTCIAQREL